MEKKDFVRLLENVTEVKSRSGLRYKIKLDRTLTNILFLRPEKTEYDKLPINELLDYINSNELITTTKAKKYIKERKQSPAVAIIDSIIKNM